MTVNNELERIWKDALVFWKFYPIICLVGRENSETVQNIWCPTHDSNLACHECKSKVLQNESTYLVLGSQTL
jgi:hypothetical protein